MEVLISQEGPIDILGTFPQIPTEFVADIGSAIPILNILNVLGTTQAAGTSPLHTTGSGNTITVIAQISQALAATDATKIGLSNFDSAAFSVDANGFVTLNGGGGATTNIDVDAFTAPGTDPVTPSAGNIVMTGGQVAAGVIGANVIRTNSLAANTVTIQIQRSAAVASTNSVNNGVSHFNSAEFIVDANGFVSLAGGGLAIDSIAVQAGTSPIVPTGAGLVTINGATVAAGTNPIRTDGTGANTLAVEVQISQAFASSDATRIGLSSFDSAAFDVDANGFVQLNNGGVAITNINIDTNSAPGTDPVLPTSGGQITITGGQVATGTIGANVIRTNSVAANAFTIEIQRSTAVAASDTTQNGVSHFDSAKFTVGAGGFVSLSGTGSGQTITGDSGGALSPTAGNWNILATPTAGSSVSFSGATSTLSLNVTDGLQNTLIGLTAGNGTLSGAGNTGVGFAALLAETSGGNNTAIGWKALTANTSGGNNTAVGLAALQKNTTTSNNTGVGYQVLAQLVTGTANTGIGSSALALTTGNDNTACGFSALDHITTGSDNIGLGYQAGLNYTTSESNNIIIGNTGTAAESNTIRIGTQGSGTRQQNTCFIAGITGVSVSNKNYVTLNTSTGQLGSEASTSLFAIATQVFTANGTYTPTSGMVYCECEIVGGGGGGGGAATSGAGLTAIAGTGGSGEYARGFFSAATIGASQSVTIGAAGTAGAAGNNAGGNGGTTSLGALMSAAGGIGGGGGAAGGVVNTPGGAGGNGGSGGYFRTPGSYGGPSFAIGTTGPIVGGNGASSQLGSGAAARVGAAGAGNGALGYGAGGGGGCTFNSAQQAGAAGTAAIMIITEYVIN